MTWRGKCASTMLGGDLYKPAAWVRSTEVYLDSKLLRDVRITSPHATVGELFAMVNDVVKPGYLGGIKVLLIPSPDMDGREALDDTYEVYYSGLHDDMTVSDLSVKTLEFLSGTQESPVWPVFFRVRGQQDDPPTVSFVVIKGPTSVTIDGIHAAIAHALRQEYPQTELAVGSALNPGKKYSFKSMYQSGSPDIVTVTVDAVKPSLSFPVLFRVQPPGWTREEDVEILVQQTKLYSARKLLKGLRQAILDVERERGYRSNPANLDKWLEGFGGLTTVTNVSQLVDLYTISTGYVYEDARVSTPDHMVMLLGDRLSNISGRTLSIISNLNPIRPATLPALERTVYPLPITVWGKGMSLRVALVHGPQSIREVLRSIRVPDEHAVVSVGSAPIRNLDEKWSLTRLHTDTGALKTVSVRV